MEFIINNERFLVDDISIPISYKIEDGDGIVSGTSSKTVNLPSTPQTQAIFDYVEDIKSIGVTQNQKPTIIAYDDGTEIVRGYIKMQKVSIGLETTYDFTIISDNRDWASAFKQRSLLDEDWSGADHQLTYTSQLNSETTYIDDLVMYPLINYGNPSGAGGNIISVRDRYPSFNVGEIIYRMFKTQGFTISSNFKTSFIDKLFITIDKPFFHSDDFRTEKLFKVGMSGDQTISGSTVETIIELDTEDFDNGGNFDTGTYKYTVPAISKQSFSATITHEGQSGNYDTIVRLVKYSSGVQTTLKEVVTNGGYLETINIQVNDVVLNTGTQVYLTIEAESGNVFIKEDETRLSNDVSLYYDTNSLIEINSIMPDINQLDLLKALKDLFNLSFYTDQKERIVYFEPEDDFYNGSEVDISGMVDYNKEISIGQYTPAKNINFQLSKDNNDKYLEAHNELLDAPLGYSNQQMNNQFGATKKDYTNFFPATYMDKFSWIGLYNTSVPKIWKETSMPAFSTEFKSRLLYYNGVQNTVNNDMWTYWIAEYNPSINVSGTSQGRTTYPQTYFYDLDSVNQNSLLFDDKPGSRGLVNKHHKGRLNKLNNSRILNVYLNISPSFINSFSFRNKYRIESSELPETSELYRLIEIGNYDKNKGSSLCKLVQVPHTDPLIDTEAEDGGYEEQIILRVTDGFNRTEAGGTEILSGGEKIAEYTPESGFVGNGEPLLIEVDDILQEMYVESNGKLVKMTI